MELANAYLKDSGREGWSAEVASMIGLHHKITRVNREDVPLAEVFRKGDWVDVTMGMRSFGLPRLMCGAC